MTPVSLILGDQLFQDLSTLPSERLVMVEDGQLARHSRYHSHRLVLTFAAMRSFAQERRGQVAYSTLDQGLTVFEGITRSLEETGSRELHHFEPADAFFAIQLAEWAEREGVALIPHENPMFLTSSQAWSRYAESAKRRLMADFYKKQRVRLGLLVDEKGGPVGGRWSFDAENRRSLPKGVTPPYAAQPTRSSITQEVIHLVKCDFPESAGDPEEFAYPVTHHEALEWLEDFAENRLDLFGDYEDALSQRERILYHSLLTPLLNTGLLTPTQVLDRVMQRHEARPVPLNSLEGFVRQLIGWREFVRGVSREPARGSRVFPHERKLAPCWFAAKTGLPPLDLSLERARRFGWCHHIERLMVIGSVMFMAQVDPDEVYRFFMEMFVDAADWVMGPNVYGMSQFASADTFATKPYISGSAYVLRMSDYQPGPWCDVWDGLYWLTISRNLEFFSSSPRMAQAVRSLAKLPPDRKERIFSAAESFIDRTTSH